MDQHDNALRLLEHRIDQYNSHYRCDFNDIRVKKMKSRWGSCSEKKNLNFNVKILQLPLLLIDYIVVHELCHLIELNHSHKFWQLVAQTIPDHRVRRQELRQVQQHLTNKRY